MSILSSLCRWLEGFAGMELQIMTDQTGEAPSSYALAPSGSGKTSRDICGNRVYQNSYTFYAKEAASDEVDRGDNHDFLESFGAWIEDKSEAGELPAFGESYLTEEIAVSNAMLFDIGEDGTGLYQIQLQIIFTKRRDII